MNRLEAAQGAARLVMALAVFVALAYLPAPGLALASACAAAGLTLTYDGAYLIRQARISSVELVAGLRSLADELEAEAQT